MLNLKLSQRAYTRLVIMVLVIAGIVLLVELLPEVESKIIVVPMVLSIMALNILQLKNARNFL
jgi:hypothetical protein